MNAKTNYVWVVEVEVLKGFWQPRFLPAGMGFYAYPYRADALPVKDAQEKVFGKGHVRVKKYVRVK